MRKAETLDELRARYRRDYLEATQDGRRAFGVRAPRFDEYLAARAVEEAREDIEAPSTGDQEFLKACGISM